jgi:uroporphyrinogen III methyltransferase / synthase
MIEPHAHDKRGHGAQTNMNMPAEEPADRGPQPLLGKRVMVTRPEVATAAAGADPLAEQLHCLGAEVIVQPAIRIGPPADWRPADDALDRLRQFDWLVFSSVNGVRFLLERLRGRMGGQHQGGQYPFPRLAAIGPGTADELARYGLKADLVPERFRAEALADALAKGAAGRRFLLARASRGREVLAETLQAAGALVEQIVVYTSTDVERPDPPVAALLAAGRIDWVTVTSSAIARSLVRLFGDDLRRAKLASISPLTSGILRELGHPPAVEAAEYTTAGIVAAVAHAAQGNV